MNEQVERARIEAHQNPSDTKVKRWVMLRDASINQERKEYIKNNKDKIFNSQVL